MRNIVLFASIVVNVFLIGMIAGGHVQGFRGKPPNPDFSRPDGPPHHDGGADFLPLRALETLPPDLRDQARETILASLPEARKLRLEIDEYRAELTTAWKAEVLDPDALSASYNSMLDAQQRQQDLTARTIVKILVDLPNEERVKLMTQVEEYRFKKKEEFKKRVGEKFKDRFLEEEK